MQPGRGSCVSSTPTHAGAQAKAAAKQAPTQSPTTGHNHASNTTPQRPPVHPHTQVHRPWPAAAAHTHNAPPSSHTPAPAYAPPTTASANSNEATQPHADTTATTGPPGYGPPASSRQARPSAGGAANPSRQTNRSILVMTTTIVRSFADQNTFFATEAPQAKRRTNTTEPTRTDTYIPQGGGPDRGPVRPPVRDVNSAEGSKPFPPKPKAARCDAEVALQAGATPASEETSHAFRWSARP